MFNYIINVIRNAFTTRTTRVSQSRINDMILHNNTTHQQRRDWKGKR
jgi:hypothetical protein